MLLTVIKIAYYTLLFIGLAWIAYKAVKWLSRASEAEDSAELLCALCMFTRTEANEAVTIVDGTAVCDDHLTLVSHGTEFNRALHVAKQWEREEV